jgi:hypothetical protein
MSSISRPFTTRLALWLADAWKTAAAPQARLRSVVDPSRREAFHQDAHSQRSHSPQAESGRSLSSILDRYPCFLLCGVVPRSRPSPALPLAFNLPAPLFPRPAYYRPASLHARQHGGSLRRLCLLAPRRPAPWRFKCNNCANRSHALRLRFGIVAVNHLFFLSKTPSSCREDLNLLSLFLKNLRT